eukprot:g4314.t1
MNLNDPLNSLHQTKTKKKIRILSSKERVSTWARLSQPTTRRVSRSEVRRKNALKYATRNNGMKIRTDALKKKVRKFAVGQKKRVDSPTTHLFNTYEPVDLPRPSNSSDPPNFDLGLLQVQGGGGREGQIRFELSALRKENAQLMRDLEQMRNASKVNTALRGKKLSAGGGFRITRPVGLERPRTAAPRDCQMCGNLKLTIQELVDENSVLGEALSQKESLISNENRQLQRELALLTRRRDKLETERSNFQTNLSVAHSEQEKLRKKVIKLKKELRTYECRDNELADQKRKKKNELNNVRTQLNKQVNDIRSQLKTALNDKNEIKEEINALRLRIKTYEEEAMTSKRRCVLFESKSAATKKHLTLAQEEIANRKKELNELYQREKEKEQNLSIVKENLNQIRNEKVAAEKERNRFREEVKRVQLLMKGLEEKRNETLEKAKSETVSMACERDNALELLRLEEEKTGKYEIKVEQLEKDIILHKEKFRKSTEKEKQLVKTLSQIKKTRLNDIESACKQAKKDLLQQALQSVVRLCIVAPSVSLYINDDIKILKGNFPIERVKKLIEKNVLPRYTELYKQAHEGISPSADSDLESWLEKMLAAMYDSMKTHLSEIFHENIIKKADFEW